MDMRACILSFCSKEMTAYEVRISDWSSGVCSSDLPEILRDKALGEAAAAPGMEEMTASAGTRRMERSSGWIAGGLFMSFSLALPAFVSMSGSADTPVAAPSTVPAESPAVAAARDWLALRSEEHTSELQSLMRISYAV